MIKTGEYKMRMWIGAALAGAMMVTMPADAATSYAWSFTADFGSPGVSSGFILSPNDEDFSGAIGTVDQSPVGGASGSGYLYFAPGSNVTFSNGAFTGYARFNRADGTFFQVSGDPDSARPEIINADFSELTGTFSPTPLTATAVAAAPEPAAWAMMIAGFGIAGGALRRSRKLRATSTKVAFA